MNKKVFIELIIIVIVIGLGIGGYYLFNKNNSNGDDNTNISDNKNNESNNENTSNGGGTLVVYYSATGSTERVAKEIASNLNADIFEIEPKEEYTSEDLNWSNSNSRVSREHNDEYLRNIELKTTKVDNFDSYDTIIIGYPIWWGIAAWPVDNFVKENDFSGKTIIPFCTSASSGLGQSGKLLEDMANGGDWKDGQRFSSSASSSDIKTWTDSLK